MYKAVWWVEALTAYLGVHPFDPGVCVLRAPVEIDR